LIYSVVCTDVNDSIGWQCDLLEYTWKRARQPGELLRLVTSPEGAILPRHRYARVLRIAPQAARTHGYKAFERLFALEDWLQRERPEGTVLILDPDSVFRCAFTSEVDPGAPRAQHWVDYGYKTELTQAATWPMLIHTQDLEALLPSWIEFTSAIYKATHRWESDMNGLVAAAAAGGLRFSLEAIGAFVGWPDDVVGDAPVVHYCQDVLGPRGEILWSKRTYQPWAPVTGAGRAQHSYCRDLLALVNEYAAKRALDTPTSAK
jgi:hypothetical protein